MKRTRSDLTQTITTNEQAIDNYVKNIEEATKTVLLTTVELVML